MFSDSLRKEFVALIEKAYEEQVVDVNKATDELIEGVREFIGSDGSELEAVAHVFSVVSKRSRIDLAVMISVLLVRFAKRTQEKVEDPKESADPVETSTESDAVADGPAQASGRYNDEDDLLEPDEFPSRDITTDEASEFYKNHGEASYQLADPIDGNPAINEMK